MKKEQTLSQKIKLSVSFALLSVLVLLPVTAKTSASTQNIEMTDLHFTAPADLDSTPFAVSDNTIDTSTQPTTVLYVKPEITLPKNISYTPSRSNGVGDALFTTSLLATATLHAADYWSTTQALKFDNLQEGNPVMKPIAKNPYVFGAVKLGITALNYSFMKGLYKKNKKVAWILSTISNFALSYVVANNFKLIQKAQGMN